MRHLLTLWTLVFLAACSSASEKINATDFSPKSSSYAADSESDSGGGSALLAVALYLPNRVLDLFDMVRFGVNVGPGFGVDARATRLAQVVFMSRLSGGVGLQSLRHLPAVAGFERVYGIGPLEATTPTAVNWYKSATDLRVDLHLLLVGAHVAIDPMEIVDFACGILAYDLSGDDY